MSSIFATVQTDTTVMVVDVYYHPNWYVTFVDRIPSGVDSVVANRPLYCNNKVVRTNSPMHRKIIHCKLSRQVPVDMRRVFQWMTAGFAANADTERC